MSKKEHLKHHYIPQCYFRNFANNNGKNIYTYDKIESKTYNSAISSICCIDDFYSILPEFINKENPNRRDELAIECDYFAEYIEPMYSKVLSWLINRKNECLRDESKNVGLSYEDKVVIAKYIVIQYLRLPHEREQTLEVHDDMMKQIIPMFKSLVANIENQPEINDLQIGWETDPALLHAQYTFLNDEFANEFAEALANNYWGFLVSEDSAYYTSDFPITVEPHVPNVRPMFLGLTQYGAEMTFPISSEIVISIWDKEYFKDKSENDCKFYLVDKKEERRQNYFRYFYARRQVFSLHNDFSLIELSKMVQGGKHIFMGQCKNNKKQ